MVSIVIPTFNRAGPLRMTLDRLSTQATAGTTHEVVVVDNNSSDETRAVVEAAAARQPGVVRYVHAGEQGSSAARNAGIAASRGQIIAFIDDDVLVAPGWIDAMAEAFRAHPDAWCVGGKVVLRLPEDLPAWFDAASQAMTTYLSQLDYGDATERITPPRVLISANLAVRRDALARVGGFDTRLGRFGLGLFCGEDTELCHRIWQAGGAVYYCGRAAVVHAVPESRISRRFFRARAYWEGRTEGALTARAHGVPSRARLRREAWTIVKEAGNALSLYIAGRRSTAFEYELGVWKRWGYIHHSVSQPPAPQGAPARAGRGEA